MIDQNKTFRSEKSARALPGQARVYRRLWLSPVYVIAIKVLCTFILLKPGLSCYLKATNVDGTFLCKFVNVCVCVITNSY